MINLAIPKISMGQTILINALALLPIMILSPTLTHRPWRLKNLGANPSWIQVLVSIAAVMNYHNLVTENNTILLPHNSGGQESEMLFSGVGRVVLPSEAPGRNLLPCFFQLLEVIYILWLEALSSVFKASNVAS